MLPGMKPYSESCAQNQGPILEVLEGAFRDRKRVLEIGSGTGQHAIFFAKHLAHLTWQTSDLAHNHAGIQAWLEDANLPNVLPPLQIDANDSSWPVKAGSVDAVFSANAVHIMGWPAVEGMFRGIGEALTGNGMLCLYGPFNYGGKFTSESNAYFDKWLKSNDPVSGVRDFEALDLLANKIGLKLLRDVPMPANNRTLLWQRSDG
jgi:cyclopropane fatty-acyl-phospholipid synthase-like methyltransferase